MGLPRQTDTAALRVLRITELLFGNVLDGFSNKEIADALGYSPSNVCAVGVVLPPGPARPPRPPWNSRPQDWWPTCAATASPCLARSWRKVCIWPEPRA